MNSIFQEGTITVIDGVMGSGKTDFAMLISKLAVHRRYNLGTNIRTDLKGSEMLSSDIALLDFCLEHDRNVIALDEANIFQSAKRSGTQDAVYLEALVAIIRKLRAALIFIIQRQANLLPMIRELTYCEITKITKQDALMKLPDTDVQLANIPSCREFKVAYETYAFASFKFQLDLTKLLSDLSGITYLEATDKLKKLKDERYKPYWRKDTKEEDVCPVRHQQKKDSTNAKAEHGRKPSRATSRKSAQLQAEGLTQSEIIRKTSQDTPSKAQSDSSSGTATTMIDVIACPSDTRCEAVKPTKRKSGHRRADSSVGKSKTDEAISTTGH